MGWLLTAEFGFLLFVGGIGLLVLILCRRTPAANEVIVITGRRRRRDADGLAPPPIRIANGSGTYVLPILHRAQRLNLDLKDAPLKVECVTSQGVPIKVHGVVIFKVADDELSIFNAARRFIDQQGSMKQRVTNVFTGHLRAILGTMTIEEIITSRESLAERTRSHSGLEMQKLGILVDSLQVDDIVDPTGYIEHLRGVDVARVKAQARIAEAENEQRAVEAEQSAAIAKAKATRDAEAKARINQAENEQRAVEAEQSAAIAKAKATRDAELEIAEFAIQTESAKARVDVAYNESFAKASLNVSRQHTELAHQEARLEEAKLDASVRKSAEAHAFARLAQAQAESDAIKLTGRAAAEVLTAKSAALVENPEAVISQQLAEVWPEIVRAAAKPMSDADNLVLLNGSQGISDLLIGAITRGAVGMDALRELILPERSSPEREAPVPLRSGDDAA
ncbi:flotillin family protein [Pseudonocardia xinjiangensis]|uniref:Flotillin family protein n=1 Tax=Pseudonocardia xinjiangensis TaxID=75289 RepID=A0ABX1RDW6_9PSEU|nr:flotillin family protein [Pseudonocardia xinjiangensis]NMH78573.1 flotillin family protein [Pseudonocardia xinjiangensis]